MAGPPRLLPGLLGMGVGAAPSCRGPRAEGGPGDMQLCPGRCEPLHAGRGAAGEPQQPPPWLPCLVFWLPPPKGHEPGFRSQLCDLGWITSTL